MGHINQTFHVSDCNVKMKRICEFKCSKSAVTIALLVKYFLGKRVVLMYAIHVLSNELFFRCFHERVEILSFGVASCRYSLPTRDLECSEAQFDDSKWLLWWQMT